MKIIKHTALFLLGVFVYPIIFQPVHIVWHHSSAVVCCGPVCSTKIKFPDVNAETNASVKKGEHCPICEYRFSINKLPVVSAFEAMVPVVNAFYNESELVKAFSCFVFTKSPRAPPFS